MSSLRIVQYSRAPPSHTLFPYTTLFRSNLLTGDQVKYAIAVTNTGDVTLADLQVNDPGHTLTLDTADKIGRASCREREYDVWIYDASDTVAEGSNSNTATTKASFDEDCGTAATGLDAQDTVKFTGVKASLSIDIYFVREAAYALPK